MYFRILSDIGVTVDEVRYAISAGRQRAAFCVLALASNREVGRNVLVDAIWGELIPKHPDTALHIIVSRLRGALGPAAPRLVSVPSGYRLDLAAEELDLTVVQSQFILGRSLLHDNEPHRAAEVLTAALEPWNEAAMADLAQFPFYVAAKIELTELRRSIEEVRNDALLAAGRHVEVLANLQGMITANPWREHLRRQRVLAYYRSGRQVDALRELDEFRALLVEQLGVEPTVELRDLHLRILDQDASLQIPRSGVAVPLPAWTATSLPFVGRSDEEEQTFARLREVGAGGRRIVLIEGEAGIGKTRLMLEVARRMADDTILIPATANDATRGTLVGLAESLASVSARLSDHELRLCLGRRPSDIANSVPAIARRLPDLVTPDDVDDQARAERLRESLITWVIALSQRAPVVMLIDDIDRAGPALFAFIGHLFARTEHQRTLVIATARSREGIPSTGLELLLQHLEELQCLDRLQLDGLDVVALERLVMRLGMSDGSARARALFDATAGHPFFVTEVLQSGDWDGVIPASVREFVRRRVRSLGLPEQDTVECAAAFVTGFDIPLLREVTGLTETLANQHVDRALDAGILRAYDVGSFTFVHELTRRAILESLDPERDAELHRRIAVALEAREASPVILATHWRRAAGDDARGKTFHYATVAAAELLQSLEPESATRWLELAVASAGSPSETARARLALAEAQHKAGDPACVESYRAAISFARAHDDHELLAACASGWTPIWSSAPPLAVDERIALLEDSRTAIVDNATRSRVVARLATELLFTSEHERAAALARSALADARRSQSDAAFVEVAMRYFQVVWCPHTLHERRALIDEAGALLENDDVFNRCFTLSLTAAAAIESADLHTADAALSQMWELAESSSLPFLTMHASGNRAWRAALAGNLEDASALATQALSIANQEGDGRAAEGAMLQLGYLAWHEGRLGSLLPIVQEHDGGRMATLGTRIMVARCLAANGDSDGARALLGSVTTHDLDTMPKDMRWASTLLLAAEAAFMVEAEDVGAIVLRLLEPFRDQIAFANFVVAPVAYGAGLAAAAAGRDGYASFFEQALELSDRLEAPVLRARTEIAWDVACQGSGRPAGRATTIRALDPY